MTEADRAQTGRPAAAATTGQALREAVLRRLAMLERIAASGESEFPVPVARAELSKLADGWRVLLATHQPDPDGKCTACPRSFWRRHWPCRVWLMAYEHFVDDGVPRQRRRTIFRRMRRDLPRS